MNANARIELDRRRFLRLSAAGAAVGFIALHMPGGTRQTPRHHAPTLANPLDAGVVVAQGDNVATRLRAALAPLGGLAALARPGDIVAIKPTLAWNRHPDFAANTSPAVLREVVRLCLEAGAAEVRVFDRTSFKANVCYQIAGATAALAKLDRRRVRLLALSHGDFLPVAPADGSTPRWRVIRHIMEADRFINLPVAKHHPTRQVALGLSNLLGAVGGAPTAPDWDNSAFIAEIAQLIQPDLTIIDAARVLVSNGPLGLSRADVRQLDTLVLGADAITVDAIGATLFERAWHAVDHIRVTAEQQARSAALEQIKVVRV